MSTKDMVHIVGAALAHAREAQGLSQRALSAAYAEARAHLAVPSTVAPRTFANSDLSRLEKTVPGQVVGTKRLVPSRQKRTTAALLAQVLRVDLADLILEIGAVPRIFASENPNRAESLISLTLLGTEAERPALELTFIPGSHRAAFFGLDGSGLSYTPTETRRQYLRGAPANILCSDTTS